MHEAREVAPATRVVVSTMGTGRLSAACRVVPENHPREAHGRRAVRERVVDAPYEREPRPQRHHVHVPQWPPAVKALLEQPRDLDAQAGGVERRVNRPNGHVIPQVELGIGDPGRIAVGSAETPGQLGDASDPRCDLGTQRIGVRLPLFDHDDLAGVSGDLRALQVEDRPILRPQRDRVFHGADGTAPLVFRATAPAGARPRNKVPEKRSALQQLNPRPRAARPPMRRALPHRRALPKRARERCAGRRRSGSRRLAPDQPLAQALDRRRQTPREEPRQVRRRAQDPDRLLAPRGCALPVLGPTARSRRRPRCFHKGSW